MSTVDFEGRVAVVTGGASGIGAGLARQAARRGMRVVLADVDADGLRRTEIQCAKLAGDGNVASLLCDVTDWEQVRALEAFARERFQSVHLLFNNAGTMVDGVSWERSLDDWRWVVDVNLFGVIHGLKAFVPMMLEHGQPGCVVNTSSVAGLLAGPFLGPYTASKHAVVGVSETLHHEFRACNAALGVAVLCPGEVATGICDSQRARPAQFGQTAEIKREEEFQMRRFLREGVSRGMRPDDLAEFAFDGIAEGHFWLLPHPEFKTLFERRVGSVLNESLPPSGMEVS